MVQQLVNINNVQNNIMHAVTLLIDINVMPLNYHGGTGSGRDALSDLIHHLHQSEH